MVACSASEVAAKVAALEGLAPEPLSPTTKRCSRIYNECQSREGQCSVSFRLLVENDTRSSLLSQNLVMIEVFYYLLLFSVEPFCFSYTSTWLCYCNNLIFWMLFF